eukprot:CAMPEP_0204843582 /NCGR_PEP_ID=MMETSP1346-20131115/48062_1 /ASSEMBLY_ACC=CAM_ASM_000771 /TAXON_ID=215587 /ORGANISM="Aplanochytrium stocchinoi, Strain GSBS06" /LENGTH=136 /DNA_ID=CAMNT_0051982745 /DNA_START=70 /DNA_END=477 /DNA_ORIENTATION=-
MADTIFRAISRNDLDSVRAFIEYGTDVNTRNEEGLTLLQICQREGKNDIVAYLLRQGADATILESNQPPNMVQYLNPYNQPGPKLTHLQPRRRPSYKSFFSSEGTDNEEMFDYNEYQALEEEIYLSSVELSHLNGW